MKNEMRLPSSYVALSSDELSAVTGGTASNIGEVFINLLSGLVSGTATIFSTVAVCFLDSASLLVSFFSTLSLPKLF